MSESTYVFRLYVAGMTTQNLRALKAVRRLCDEVARNDHDLQVIDLLVTPEAATQDKVVATPTLVKAHPAPPVWIMGDLLNVENIRRLLTAVEEGPRREDLRVAASAALPRD